MYTYTEPFPTYQLPSPSRVLATYENLSARLTEKYRERIFNADPRVGRQYAFHLASNWGNAEAKRLERQHTARLCALGRRKQREFRRAEHLARHGKGWDYRPVWCAFCQADAV